MKHGLALALGDAAPVVAAVARGKSLNDALSRVKVEGESGRAALLDLTYGTLRRYGRVQFMVRALSHRLAEDKEVEALLWCALYALESGRYSEYTVVDQAVRACGLLEKWNAKGYINAVLRGYVRRAGELRQRSEADPEARYQHPAWWIDALRRAHPEAWERVLDMGNQHPPMAIRVNRRYTSIDAYQARLAVVGIAAARIAEDGLLLERPMRIERLPGFAEGHVSVQDAGAQAVADYLDARDGMRVLDACAAPGGKTGHLLERADLDLLALDEDPARLQHVRTSLDRLKLAATLRCADCTQIETWWDGVPFQRILADVPCSASGVVRRHPDIKWLRRSTDVEAFAQRQAGILAALWRPLAAGGKLLYVTCSVFPQENEHVVDAFVARTGGARRLPLPDGCPGQMLPDPQHDGFYYALIAKEA